MDFRDIGFGILELLENNSIKSNGPGFIVINHTHHSYRKPLYITDNHIKNIYPKINKTFLLCKYIKLIIETNEYFRVRFDYIQSNEIVIVISFNVKANISRMDTRWRDVAASLFSWLCDDWSIYDNGVSSLKALYSRPTESHRNSLLGVFDQIPKPVITLRHRSTPGFRNRICLEGLSRDIVSIVMKYLDVRSLQSLMCCNWNFKESSLSIFPGLLLELYKHQRTSVWWMMRQEALYDHANQRSPFLRSLTCRPLLNCVTDKPFYSDCVKNNTSDENNYEFIDRKDDGVMNVVYDYAADILYTSSGTDGDSEKMVRGGLLCDEPGLGKTITLLALVLQTSGIESIPKNEHLIANGNKICRQSTHSSIPSTPSMNLRSPQSRRRSVQPQSLLPTCCTLIVVPDNLLNQWAYQITNHVDCSILGKVHIDSDTSSPLPSAQMLSSCKIVVTTFKRLSVEWKYGRPASMLDSKMLKCSDEYHSPLSTTPRRHRQRNSFPPNSPGACTYLSPLLEIYWLRVVVDEGHQLGKSVITNTIRMAETLECERRWILTGTPTHSQNTVTTGTVLKHVFMLLKFLRYQPLRRSNADRLWKTYVSTPMEKGVCGFSWENGAPATPSTPLRAILSQVMIRHTKDNTNIPKPIYHTSLLEMNRRERESYNAITALAQANLVTTGKDYMYPDGQHKDSLLHKDSKKFLQETLANIRVACCGGGHSSLSLIPEEKRRDACIRMLREKLRCNDQIVDKVDNFIMATVKGDLSQCEWCGIQIPLLLIAPCGHLQCPECMENTPRDSMGDYCVCCKSRFDWNDLQRLQPGFEASNYVFDTSSPSSLEAADDSNIRISTKANHVVVKIKALERRFFERQKQLKGTDWKFERNSTPKVIVFSQFFEFLDSMAADLKQAGISYVYFVGKNKARELRRFSSDPTVRVLFLTREGSHGLDLSYVTHIFLMDSILDDSLFQQVISRAYRMGSRQSVEVDQLIMKDTIEEVIHSMRQNQAMVSPDTTETRKPVPRAGSSENAPTMNYLVKQLRLLRYSHDNSGVLQEIAL